MPYKAKDTAEGSRLRVLRDVGQVQLADTLGCVAYDANRLINLVASFINENPKERHEILMTIRDMQNALKEIEEQISR